MYEICLVGEIDPKYEEKLLNTIARLLEPQQLELGKEILVSKGIGAFRNDPQSINAIVFFGSKEKSEKPDQIPLSTGVPIITIVSQYENLLNEIPEYLQHINAISFANLSVERVATCILEKLDLLPSQRVVFLSYRRDESREIALQLYDSLLSRQYEVFLDTHSVPLGSDFQDVLWHKLCCSDVLIMLDTTNYFNSRWSSAEFGRALSKNIPVLRVGWPGVLPSNRVATTSSHVLNLEEFDDRSLLKQECLNRICDHVEVLRCQGIGLRRTLFQSHLRLAITSVMGEIEKVNDGESLVAKLPNGDSVNIIQTLTVPDATTFNNAEEKFPNSRIAVVYDHIGVMSSWIRHLNWLGGHIRTVRWIKKDELAWKLAAWEVE